MMKRKQDLRKTLALVLAIVFLISLVPATVFADEPEEHQSGEITGQFGTTTAPEVTSIVIHNEGTEVVPTDLTPQQQYDIKVNVTNEDDIDELDELVVKLWFDSPGNAYEEGDFDSATADAQEVAVITWERSGNTAALTPGDTSWSLDDQTLPESVDFDGTSFEFVFTITIGKVAKETATQDNKWQLAAKVTDQGSLDHYLAYSVGEEYGLGMNWYGEIEVPDAHQVNWGSIPAGIDFDHVDAVKRVVSGESDEIITFIANGGYQEQVKADTTWNRASGDGPTEVTRNTDAAAENTFALAIDTTDTYDGEAEGSSILLAADDFIGFRGGAPKSATNEAGDEVSDYYMFIKLSDPFAADNPSSYSGGITFGITNAAF